MNSRYLYLLWFISTALISCKKIKVIAPERIQLDSTLVLPVSELNVPVYYPLQELENMINDKLAGKVIEANLAIDKKKRDSLFLEISRFKPVTLDYDGDHGITYIVPLEINGHVDAKVVGIAIRNKEPVHAKIIITMFSDLYLDDQWNLDPRTELKKVEWIEEPKIKIAGIKFNLKGAIENGLEKNKDKIVNKLDESAKSILKIRQPIEKLWGDIQKPIRINKKIVPVWLKAEATDMDGRLFRRSKDTLMIEVKLNAMLRTVFDSAKAVVGPLPSLRRKVDKDPGLDAYALVTVPFKTLNDVVSQITDTMKFSFPGHSVRIASSEVYGTKEGLAIRISLKGDLKADLYLKGTIGFDSLERKVFIENFGFDLNSEESLLSAADWFAHDEVINRLKPYMSIPLHDLFDVIPNLITKGIEKGKLGKKVDIHFSDFHLNIYQYLITSESIQIIATVKGRADVELQKGLFVKKKKPV